MKTLPPDGGWRMGFRLLGLVALVLSLMLLGPVPVLANTPTPTAEETPVPPQPTYTVRPGDTLFAIARRFNVDLDALMRVNGIADPKQLRPGMRLVLPGLEGVQGELTTVPIGWCEDLESLARRYDMDTQALARLNRLLTPQILYPGRALILPQKAAKEDAPRKARYLLGEGETLLEAAVRTDRSPWSLALQNRLAGPWAALPGEVLLVSDPEGSSDMGACPPQVQALHLNPEEGLQQGRTWALWWVFRPGTGVKRLEGRWRGRPMLFHPWEVGETKGPQWVGLQGVHALTRPQVYPLEVRLELEDGTVWVFHQPLRVAPGDFRYEELTVPLAYLDPKVGAEESALVREVMSRITQPRRWEGPFQAPVANGDCITSPFGTRRNYNQGAAWGYHAGVDFCSGAGQPVYAPAPGRVVLARALTIRGNVVVLDHGWGVYTGYWHLSRIAVQEGQEVQTGDLLGAIGGTGRVTGPHLHWELWVGGVPVNPLDWLKTAFP